MNGLNKWAVVATALFVTLPHNYCRMTVFEPTYFKAMQQLYLIEEADHRHATLRRERYGFSVSTIYPTAMMPHGRCL